MARYTHTPAATLFGLNAELKKIEVAIRDTLSRKGDVPNQMESVLDMNSYRIINLPEPISGHEPARLEDLRRLSPGGLSAENVGTGAEVYKDAEGEALRFRTLRGVGGTTVAESGLSLIHI